MIVSLRRDLALTENISDGSVNDSDDGIDYAVTMNIPANYARYSPWCICHLLCRCQDYPHIPQCVCVLCIPARVCVCECMCECVCVCVYVCVHACVHVRVYMHAYVRVFM